MTHTIEETSPGWTREENCGSDRLTAILGIVVGLLTALAANLMLH